MQKLLGWDREVLTVELQMIPRKGESDQNLCMALMRSLKARWFRLIIIINQHANQHKVPNQNPALQSSNYRLKKLRP